ncbi:cytochrome c [Candidatus Binatia bacterium]|jgi:mono/diheme cytochrome c family protein|nr:cytochrome c [Candidatus Binatia bacterium]
MTASGSRARSALCALVACALLSASGAAFADDAQIEQGQKIFKDQGCPQCHGFGGKGDGYLLGMLKEPVKMHDWTDPALNQSWTDQYLLDITKKGGEAIGKNKVMLKYGNKMSDEQIRLVIVFLRSVAAKPTP